MSCTLRTAFVVIAKCRVAHVRTFASQTAPVSKTIDKYDVENLAKYAEEWWNIKGPVGPLHSFNPVRIQFIRDGLANVGHKENSRSKPLEGLNILEVGCGAGILTENLARIGANLTGIDVCEDLIEAAKLHAAQDKTIADRVSYIPTSIDEHAMACQNYYDVVVASEVVEHVADQDLFLKKCIEALKPGGSIFVTTVNQTYLSLFGAIFLAEYVFRVIPRGTHQWQKFISPEIVRCIFEKYGCQTKLLHGFGFNPINLAWRFSRTTAISYGIHAQKHMD